MKNHRQLNKDFAIDKVTFFSFVEKKKMETIILSGNSKVNSELLLKLAKQLNFSAKKLSSEELEEFGIGLSIQEGLKSGILEEKEKLEFLNRLRIE